MLGRLRLRHTPAPAPTHPTPELPGTVRQATPYALAEVETEAGGVGAESGVPSNKVAAWRVVWRATRCQGGVCSNQHTTTSASIELLTTSEGGVCSNKHTTSSSNNLLSFPTRLLSYTPRRHATLT